MLLMCERLTRKHVTPAPAPTTKHPVGWHQYRETYIYLITLYQCHARTATCLMGE